MRCRLGACVTALSPLPMLIYVVRHAATHARRFWVATGVWHKRTSAHRVSSRCADSSSCVNVYTRSRFLQGPGTDKRAVREIRRAIDTNTECTVRLLNYTKSGQPFWCALRRVGVVWLLATARLRGQT